MASPAEQPGSIELMGRQVIRINLKFFIYAERGAVRLLIRTGLGWTSKYPAIAAAVAEVPARQFFQRAASARDADSSGPSGLDTRSVRPIRHGTRREFTSAISDGVDGGGASKLCVTRLIYERALIIRENYAAKSSFATYEQPANCQTRDLPSAA